MVIFDGKTQLHVGEALVVVLRFVDGFVIKQVHFQTLANSKAGKKIHVN